MSESRTEGPLIYLIACEASGDQIGGLLMAALRTACLDKVRFAGMAKNNFVRLAAGVLRYWASSATSKS